MLRDKSRLTLAVALVAATMLVAGGVAVASNTGFKINKPLSVVVTTTSQVGTNWTSIPYFNPYGNGANLCAQLGLASTGGVRGLLLKIDAGTGASLGATCGTAGAASFTWNQGQGVRIRNQGVGAPTSAIIVGSHNPAASLTVPTPAATGNVGNFWFALPYHTTAITAADLCASVGLQSVGAARGSVGRLNAATGSFSSANCGTAGASSFVLVLGEAVRLRNAFIAAPNSLPPVNFVPAHF